MATLKTIKIKNNLTKKGFQIVESDHTRLVLFVNNKKTEIRTKISHGAKEIGDDLILQMAKQIRLSKEDFIEFAKCNISGEEYLKMIGF